MNIGMPVMFWETPNAGQSSPSFSPGLIPVWAEVLQEQVVFPGSLGRGWCCIAVQVRDVLPAWLCVPAEQQCWGQPGDPELCCGATNQWTEWNQWGGSSKTGSVPFGSSFGLAGRKVWVKKFLLSLLFHPNAEAALPNAKPVCKSVFQLQGWKGVMVEEEL